MKKHLISLFVAFYLIGTFALFAQNKKLVPYAVAFYNLENLFDTINNNGKYDLEFSPAGAKQWDGKKYWAKIDRMAYCISQLAKENCPMGPAVIGVSEIENRSVLEDLVKAKDIAHLNYQIVHYDSPDLRGVDVGLLYNPLLFTVTSAKSYPFILPDKPYWKSRDQLLVSGIMNGENFHFIVNHWPSRRNGEKESRPLRVAAARLSKHICDSIRAADPTANVIIMGDLNDDPNNVSVRDVLAAKEKRKNVKPGDLFNPMSELHKKGIGSLGYQGSWNLFDQIIITGNLLGDDRNTFKFWKAEVFNKDFLIQQEGRYKGYPLRTYSSNVFQNGYSDHFPVLVYLIKYYNE